MLMNRFKKLSFKKEINSKQNRNYHMDLNNPSDIKKYLEYNKRNEGYLHGLYQY